MSAIDNEYKRIINLILRSGEIRPNRTGVDTIAIPSATFTYDMTDGFPILHNKKISFKVSKVELIGFLMGITDKSWYQNQGCNIWNEWCRPDYIPKKLVGQEKFDFMRTEMDLGPIYGHQWRRFNIGNQCDYYEDADQIKKLLHSLENTPDSRRMIVNAWNPLQLDMMALPPCHYGFQVLVINGKLHLNWNQRSVDTFLGLPYNICFYGTLLSCLAHQFELEVGMLTGFLGDTHLYMNHMDAVDEYINRPDAEDCNPTLIFSESFNKFNILDDELMMKLRVSGYNPLTQIKADVAV